MDKKAILDNIKNLSKETETKTPRPYKNRSVFYILFAIIFGLFLGLLICLVLFYFSGNG